MRTAVGGALWRRLRARSAFAHIAALISAILDLGALVTRLIKRLERRFTRLCPLVLVHAHADAQSGLAFARVPPGADSS